MFQDRSEAGRLLAKKLASYADRSDAVVLGLPRGGVPVAFEIAREFHLPLDILLVRKLGVPGQSELAMGAIGTGGIRILDHVMIRQLGITENEVTSTIREEEEELQRREQIYKNYRGGLAMKDLSVIVVDDGIATGSSMLAAIQVLRSQQPAGIIVAVPVAPPHARTEIEAMTQEFVCLRVSEYFPAVGSFYRDFSQVDDQEVCRLLASSAQSFANRTVGPSS
ncbi:phosphoribosyltransferase [Alloacidobacterium dinghuense]|uniref:Phosphoribosyltransferase n=1 Tax=Alloacidobacterium dinghuense TaxID=2763107 RepID=A0A7G8BK80_9BACT|nr:phosphoribosyltransferase family protein [Alloacidobacterium dinghuense]QNI32950.1 phosphoribosyltransferase [Alloacidobacterium dinghuense]